MTSGEYEITLDDDRGLVRVVVKGMIKRELGEEIITTARTVGAQKKYHIIYDMRQATADVTLADWYFLPQRLTVLKKVETRILRAAVLIQPDEQQKDYQFYETVMNNQGMRVRIFLKEQMAIKWLSEG